MSSTIDQNVVQMQFDNSNFEKNVQTSMLSLDNLKRSITLGGAANGLVSSIETISGRFSTMGIIGVTALQNITNSAINTSKRLLSSLTIDPVKTGLSEYEEKINSVQTILMGAKNKDGTAVSLGQVKSSLEELNKYADKTIYSFQDMTSNIGKFTNAGVDLDTAVAAIQGVSNVAAVSGANAQQASHAMYNFSQALSAGYVKLIDWKSIENAGMATQEFKTQLLDAGVAAGTLEKTSDGMYKVLTKNGQGSTMDNVIDASKNFNDSLGYQWMTTEVLTNTLGKYADESTNIGKKAFAAAQDVKTFTQLLDTLREAAQSGWAMTWEYIIGDFEQAKKLWTGVSQEIGGIIDKQAEDRNKLIKGWAEGGGREALFNAIKNSWNAFMDVATNVGEAFREVFPATTSKRLIEITQALEKFTSKLTMSDTTAQNFNATFRGIFAGLDLIKQAISAVFRVVSPVLGLLPGISSGLLSVTGNLGSFIFNLDESVKKNDTFYKALKKIFDTVANSTPFKILKSGIELVRGGFSALADKASEVANKIKDFLGNLSKDSTEKTSSASNAFTTFLNVLRMIGTAAKNTLKLFADAFSNAFKDFSLDEAQGVVNGGILTMILLGLKKFIDGLKESVKDLTGLNLIKSIKETLGGVQDAFSSFTENMKAGALLKIAAAIGILALALVVLSGINPEKMSNALLAITGLFADLMGSLAVFEKISGSTKGLSKAASGMIKMSAAVLILSIAMEKLSSIPWEGLKQGLLAVTILCGVLVTTAILLGKFGDKQAGAASKGMITMSIALNIMASAVKKLAEMNPEQLMYGLLSIGILLSELAFFLTVTDFDGMGISSGAGILLVAASLKVLAGVIATLSQMKPSKIGIALLAIGALLTEIGVFTKLTSGSSGVLATSAALVIMAAGINILVGSLMTLSTANPLQLAVGLLTLAGALGMIVLALNLMTGGVAGAAAIAIVAISLNMLVPVLNAFAGMSLTEIAKSLGMLAGVFAIFGIAGLLLAPLTPVLLLLAGAIALLGVGIIGIGAGLLMVSAGILAFSAALGAGAGTIVASIGLIVTGVVGLIPLIATAIAQGIVTFAETVLSGSAQIVGAAVELGTALLGGIASLAPALVNTGMVLILSLLQGVAANIGQIATVAGLILINFILGLAQILPGIIEAGMIMIIQFIDGLAHAIDEHGPDLLNAFMNLFKSIGNLLIEALAGLAEMIPGIGDNIADGLRDAKFELEDTISEEDGKKVAEKYADGAKEGANEIPDAFGEAGAKSTEEFNKGVSSGSIDGTEKVKTDATKDLDAIIEQYGDAGAKANTELNKNLASGDTSDAAKKAQKSTEVKVDTGKNAAAGQKAGDAVAKGMDKAQSKVKKSGEKLGDKGVSGVKSKQKDFKSAGASSAEGIAKGLDSKKNALSDKGRELANTVNNSYKNALDVNSPSRVMMWNAKMTIMGLVKGFEANMAMAAKSAGAVGLSVKNAVMDKIEYLSEAFDGDFEYSPTITPVLNLNDVHSGLADIDRSIGATRALTLSTATVGNINALSGSIQGLQNGSSNADVVNAINKLRGDINSIQPNVTNVNGITYDDGSNIHDAIGTLIRATVVEGRA